MSAVPGAALGFRPGDPQEAGGGEREPGSDGPAAVRLARWRPPGGPGRAARGPRRQGSGTRQPARRSPRGLGNREMSAPRRWRPRSFQFSLRQLVTV